VARLPQPKRKRIAMIQRIVAAARRVAQHTVIVRILSRTEGCP
jgi:hypothetical protein